MFTAILLRAVILFTIIAGLVGLFLGEYPMPGGIKIKGGRIRTLGILLLLPALCNWVMWDTTGSTGPARTNSSSDIDLIVGVFTGFVLFIALLGIRQRYLYEKR